MAPPKAKGQKMGLGEFLTDASLGSWADEMEDAPMPASRSGTGFGGGDRSYNSAGGDKFSSYTDRGFSQREELPLPTKPPYTVHLGNMSFDATELDVQDFFAQCEVTHVRIVEDRVDRKPKGFGYAEFGSLDGLKKALQLNGTQFQGRNMRISVAEPQKDRVEAREISDWTRKGPLPDVGGPKRQSDRPGFGSGRGYEPAGESGQERGGRNRFEQGDGKVRDFGNWERKGPLTPTAPSAAPAGRHLDRPSSKDGPRERRNSPAWGEGRSQDGSRPPRREFVERPPPPDRQPTAAEQDNQWRARMRPDAPAASRPDASPALSGKESSAPSSPAPAAAVPAAPAAPATRPRLNLAKRTVSQAEPSPISATSGDSKASPFGAARPIDTAAREKEIEEKLKLKKEQDEKAREEKRVADEKAKEERRQAKDAERAEKLKERANGQGKEGEQGDNAAARNYQILRRNAGDEANGGQDEDANGEITEDKAVKPKEIVRDTKSANGSGAATPTAEAMDEEGWSTVSKPQKGRKGGNGGTRALAS